MAELAQVPDRNDRFHAGRAPAVSSEDQRTPPQKDRDRLLYSSAFRRLAGITQVADPSEGHHFHNRLTHTLKVAQIGRRLAERLLVLQSRESKALGGIDPDVIEAAALAHDLGQPPFCNASEVALDRLLRQKADCPNGFEGNAQSFRIVTTLASHKRQFLGLDLSRATLRATLKYPWRRAGDGKRHRKFGAYESEADHFEWAMALGPEDGRSPEAELMDWADDITYAVHDMEDFYRAGLIPLDRLRSSDHERKRFLALASARWKELGINRDVEDRKAEEILEDLFALLGDGPEPFDASHLRRATLHIVTSALITRFTNAIQLQVPTRAGEPTVVISPSQKLEVALLKELTWVYAIRNPALATQTFGKMRIIEELFEIYLSEIQSKDVSIFPERLRELIAEVKAKAPIEEHRRLLARIVADLISSFTERDAIRVHRRLTGSNLGSVYDELPA